MTVCFISKQWLMSVAITPDSNISLFADDITLYRIIKTLEDNVKLQGDISGVEKEPTQLFALYY